MVFSTTFNNILAILWRSVPGENLRPAASHWQTLSQNVVSNTPEFELTTLVVIGIPDDHDHDGPLDSNKIVYCLCILYIIYTHKTKDRVTLLKTGGDLRCSGWVSSNVLQIVVCPFLFGHCVVCSSSIFEFWLPLWYLQTLLIVSHYSNNERVNGIINFCSKF